MLESRLDGSSSHSTCSSPSPPTDTDRYPMESTVCDSLDDRLPGTQISHLGEICRLQHIQRLHMAANPAPHSPSLMLIGKSEDLGTISCCECLFFLRGLRKGPHFCLLGPILLPRRRDLPHCLSLNSPQIPTILFLSVCPWQMMLLTNSLSHCSS